MRITNYIHDFNRTHIAELAYHSTVEFRNNPDSTDAIPYNPEIITAEARRVEIVPEERAAIESAKETTRQTTSAASHSP